MISNEILCSIAPRDDLAELLRGQRKSTAVSLLAQPMPKLYRGDTLVLWTRFSARPVAIVIADNEREELFNWTTTFHRDLSPLTSWCHVLSSREAERLLDTGKTHSDLFGLEAAWAGASIAEAMVLSQRDYNSISLPSCLATDTFALGRTASLYGARSASDETIDKVDKVRELLKSSTTRAKPFANLPSSVLLRLLPDAPHTASWLQEKLVKACKRIQESPNNSSSGVFDEIREIAPQLSGLQSIDEISAEQRVKALRDLSMAANKSSSQELQVIYFAAGYIISRIGGAERDLRLAETFEQGYPIVLTWAAVLGGLGATTYWSDAFGGIGRLVARELSRSFDIFEPPSSDISADELFVLAGPDRRGPKFRTASRQSASVSLRSGVVTQLSLVEEERKSEPSRLVSPSSTTDVAEYRRNLNFAEQLFPFIRRLLIEDGFEPQRDKRNLRKSKSPQLPLK